MKQGKVIVYTHGGLSKRLRELLAFEKAALKTDDPKDTCAANHRGAIRAYELILREIGHAPDEKQSKQGDSPNARTSKR